MTTGELPNHVIMPNRIQIVNTLSWQAPFSIVKS